MFVDVDTSDGPRRVYCRTSGDGDTALVHLHGGWGYSIYPIDRQIEALDVSWRVVIPDRSGYGRSARSRGAFPLDFHQRAARETLAVMDALGLERAQLWGHSDGACIAVWMGLFAPERCTAIVLEAFHFYREKPRSREFFEAMSRDPETFGERVCDVLADEHGDDYWRELLRAEGEVWLEIGKRASEHADLYDGRLGDLELPVLILHGAQDPRTEPGEIDAALATLPAAELALIAEGRHCPHAEAPVREEATAAVAEFLARHRPRT